jgi:DNA-3-methyladenine glycosylase II
LEGDQTLEIQNKIITYELTSPEIKALCGSDERLAHLICRYGNLSYLLNTDAFSFFVETIISQMLSNKAAETISARLHNACKGALTVDAILQLDVSDFRRIGLSGRKAEYILRLAALMTDNPGYFDELGALSDSEILKRLTSLHDIGIWSAKMYLIFVLNRPDVLPYEDGAFLQAYKWLYATNDTSPASVKQNCASWAPFSSLASRYLYKALDEGLTKDAKII